MRLSHTLCTLGLASVALAVKYQTDFQPYLPKYLGSSAPWPRNANPSTPPPDTGVTRKYSFVVERSTYSPDGFAKPGILINNQFPGPLIEANYGDWIEVNVANAIVGPEEGTAVHWHGFLQAQSQFSDGVPGISQCPIAPGSNYTYRFRADVYGSTWYHGHYSGQYADGAFGPMVVHGPSHVNYDIDVGTVLLTDYYHKGYFDIVKAIAGNDSTQWGQSYQNTMINGLNPFDCSLKPANCTPGAPMAKFKFQSGKTHLIRLVNAAASGLMKFSIDQHELTIVTNDFTPLQPYNTSVVTLGVGQRTDILVYGNGTSKDAYWMRNNQSTIPCARTEPGSMDLGKAMIYYEDAETNLMPTSTSNAPWLGGDVPKPVLAQCTNDPLTATVPYYPSRPGTPDKTIVVLANQYVNATGNQVFSMNGQELLVDYSDPLLFQANTGNQTYDPKWNVNDITGSKEVRIILNSNNTSPHPMHLHGHVFWVLAEGEGFYDGSTVINPSNPQLRDTAMVRPFGYLVIQFKVDNPGVWPYHCHIFQHLSMGFGINILEGRDEIQAMELSKVTPLTCNDWNAYTKNHTVEQIDSGI